MIPTLHCKLLVLKFIRCTVIDSFFTGTCVTYISMLLLENASCKTSSLVPFQTYLKNFERNLTSKYNHTPQSMTYDIFYTFPRCLLSSLTKIATLFREPMLTKTVAYILDDSSYSR